MREAGRVQAAADRPHHAIHHAAGRHQVRAGPRVNDRCRASSSKVASLLTSVRPVA